MTKRVVGPRLQLLAVALACQSCEFADPALTTEPPVPPITATEGDVEYELNGFETAVWENDDGGVEIRLASLQEPSCVLPYDETVFQIYLAIEDPEAVPLETPIDVSAADAPLGLTFDVLHAGCGLDAAATSPVSGTITFADLSAESAAGSVELQLGEAVSLCDPEPVAIDFAWDGFEAPSLLAACH